MLFIFFFNRACVGLSECLCELREAPIVKKYCVTCDDDDDDRRKATLSLELVTERRQLIVSAVILKFQLCCRFVQSV